MIRELDLIENPSARSRAAYPYLVVMQSHLLAASNMTVVAPVIAGASPAVTLTSVSFSFDGQTYWMLVGELATVDSHRLGRALSSLSAHEEEIRRALDRLFTGF